MPPLTKRRSTATASSSALSGRPESASRPLPAVAWTDSTGPASAIWRSMSWLAISNRSPPLAAGSANHPAAPLEVAPRALGRPEAAADEQPRLQPPQQRAQLVQHIQRSPLVADGAHGAALPPGRCDRLAVGERAREWLLEVDRQAALERGDGRRRMVRGRRAHEQRIEPHTVEHRLSSRRTTARPCARRRRRPGARRDRRPPRSRRLAACRALRGDARRSAPAPMNPILNGAGTCRATSARCRSDA